MSGKRLLLLGVYGMEVVEAGGALAKNVLAGGKSYANIMLSSEASRPQVTEAAKVLGVEVSFSGFSYGLVDLSAESKKKLIKVVREVKPDIIITQDPEHSFHDLDPDRRQAMILILEAIALASRDFALDEMPGLESHPIPTIYYMTPEHPNCLVDVAPVWGKKEEAMDKLGSQMAFSGKVSLERFGKDAVKVVVPEVDELLSKNDYFSIGRRLHLATDKSFHMYHGMCSHGSFALAEPYRLDGKFHLDILTDQ
ncbi:MAG: LmbE-like protein [Dethiobacter sp.]|jgi:hypothetical protein|nr:LmbE-like protein [Dethiobacter sp.]